MIAILRRDAVRRMRSSKSSSATYVVQGQNWAIINNDKLS